MIGSKVADRRSALDEQYQILLRELIGQPTSEDTNHVSTIAARI
jgi:hypothetical protein